MWHVIQLCLYPVKGLRGCPVPALEFDELGPVGDRRFLIVDPSGRFLTQRTLPRLATISPVLTAASLTLHAPGAGAVAVARRPEATAPRRPVSVWASQGLVAEDCGPEAAHWLSTVLATPCLLVRAGPAFARPVLKTAAQAGDRHAFADAVPVLLTNAASLAALNDRLLTRGEAPVPMDRFRANVVVAGGAPFAEDDWARLRAGPLTLRSAGPCARCIVTTTDQQTGERAGPEPLRTLATFRRDPAAPTEVNFGLNLIHETPAGTLRVGDPVTPL